MFDRTVREMMDRLELDSLTKDGVIAEAKKDLYWFRRVLVISLMVNLVLLLIVAVTAIGWKLADMGYKEYALDVVEYQFREVVQASAPIKDEDIECNFERKKHIECGYRTPDGTLKLHVVSCDLLGGSVHCTRNY